MKKLSREEGKIIQRHDIASLINERRKRGIIKFLLVLMLQTDTTHSLLEQTREDGEK